MKDATPATVVTAGLSSALRTWLRKAVHVGYVFAPLPIGWKTRVASLIYRLAGWIFRGDRNYELWNREATGRRIEVEVKPVADDQILPVLASIRFPVPPSPLVSIIVPAYGNLRHTLAC